VKIEHSSLPTTQGRSPPASEPTYTNFVHRFVKLEKHGSTFAFIFLLSRSRCCMVAANGMQHVGMCRGSRSDGGALMHADTPGEEIGTA
jgi:hypothetical protein